MTRFFSMVPCSFLLGKLCYLWHPSYSRKLCCLWHPSFVLSAIGIEILFFCFKLNVQIELISVSSTIWSLLVFRLLWSIGATRTHRCLTATVVPSYSVSKLGVPLVEFVCGGGSKTQNSLLTLYSSLVVYLWSSRSVNLLIKCSDHLRVFGLCWAIQLLSCLACLYGKAPANRYRLHCFALLLFCFSSYYQLWALLRKLNRINYCDVYKTSNCCITGSDIIINEQ